MRKIINGGVDLSAFHLTELLDISDVVVDGYFHCTDNYLTSLKGCPISVIGSLYCCHNNLTSLEGAPQTVGLFFNCYDNNLTSLKGAPQTVGDTFDCRENPLTSLEGIPTSIGSHFFIDKSLKDKFPEEYIRSLSKIKGLVLFA